MAVFHVSSAAGGNWGTAASWNDVTNVPTMHASTNITITNSDKFTATFTAPNTTNACLGMLVYCVAVGTIDWTLTLYENGLATAATATLTAANRVAGCWFYIKFATPYVFTATTAGYYKFLLRTASSGTGTVAADSAGTGIAFLAVDDRNTAFGATDSAVILAPVGSTYTVTVDGARTAAAIGTADTTATPSSRNLLIPVMIHKGGLLNFDTTQSSTLTVTGSVIVKNGGQFTCDYSAASAYIGTLTFVPGTSGDYGLYIDIGGKMNFQGDAHLTSPLWKTTYSSGTGSAGSPLIVADAVGWSVDDEIVVSSTGTSATNYQESEVRYIKTVNAGPESYVLCTTKGGAAAALTYTHTTEAFIINLTRNVIINTNNVAKGWWLYNASVVAGDYVNQWVRMETLGANVTNKLGAYISTIGSYSTFDYNVSYGRIMRGFQFVSGNTTETYTGLIDVNQSVVITPQLGGIGIWNYTSNKTFNTCYVVKSLCTGFDLICVGNTFNNCIANGCNTTGYTNLGVGGWGIQGGGNNTFNSCESNANRLYGMHIGVFGGITVTNNFFNSYISGRSNMVHGTADIYIASGTLAQVVFIGGTFNSTLIGNYLNGLDGTSIQFMKYQNTVNRHRWYTNHGWANSYYSGSADSGTLKSAGSTMSLRINPEDATTGFTWEFQVVAKASSAVPAYGFVKKGHATNVSVTANLWLPGSTSADQTVTIPSDTNWNIFALNQNWSGTDNRIAKVKINCIGATGQTVDIDDLFNGTNISNDIALWYNGKPTDLITETLGDASAVWAVLTSGLTTAGTTGKLLVTTEQEVADNQALIISK